MEVEALFGRFVWRGINVLWRHNPSFPRINPTLKHNRAAHYSHIITIHINDSLILKSINFHVKQIRILTVSDSSR